MASSDGSQLTKYSTGHRKHHQHVYLFKWGRLRYGLHGILGTACLLVTVAALFLQHAHPIFVLCATVMNELLATDAYTLLDQVPHATVIWKPDRIVAPHKEAFKRTIAIFHYTSVRIIGLLLSSSTVGADDDNRDNADASLHQILLMLFPIQFYAWTLFWPFRSNFRNGNTWFFVVPMFAGATLDMCFPFRLTLFHLLFLQLSGLVLAFFFTLAFRGIVLSVHRIYFASAAVVAAMMTYGVLRILLLDSNGDGSKSGQRWHPVLTLGNAIVHDGSVSTSARWNASEL